MNFILSIVAYFWAMLYSYKFSKPAFASAMGAATSGYDRDTVNARINETTGLLLLEETMTLEAAALRVGPQSYWERLVAAHKGMRSGACLRAAGWTTERIERKVAQLTEKLTGTSTGGL